MKNKVMLSMLIAISLSFTAGCSSEDAKVNITESVETTELAKEIQPNEALEIESKKDEEIREEEDPEKKIKQEQETKEQNKTETQTKTKLEETKSKEETSNSTIPSNFIKGTVTKHVDGDTVHVTDINGQVFKIRMIGVDTPETVHTKKPVEFYGKEASDYTKEQLLNKTVYLEKDVSDTDRYGRALRYVWLSPPNDQSNITEDEIRTNMFNALLVINGFANSSTYPPDVKYQSYFTKYEAEARNSGAGLWAEDSSSKVEEPKATTQQQSEIEPQKTQETQEPKESQESLKNNNGENNNFADKSDTDKNYSYMDNSNSMKLHKINGQYAKKTSESNGVYFNSKDEASGYVPCKVCNP